MMARHVTHDIVDHAERQPVLDHPRQRHVPRRGELQHRLDPRPEVENRAQAREGREVADRAVGGEDQHVGLGGVGAGGVHHEARGNALSGKFRPQVALIGLALGRLPGKDDKEGFGHGGLLRRVAPTCRGRARMASAPVQRRWMWADWIRPKAISSTSIAEPP